MNNIIYSIISGWKGSHGKNPHYQYDQAPVATLVDLLIMLGVIVVIVLIISVYNKIGNYIRNRKKSRKLKLEPYDNKEG